MSLLMDALRKAEADKKQASAADAGTQAETHEIVDVEDDIDLAETVASPQTSISPEAFKKPEPPSSSKDVTMALEPLDPLASDEFSNTGSTDPLAAFVGAFDHSTDSGSTTRIPIKRANELASSTDETPVEPSSEFSINAPSATRNSEDVSTSSGIRETVVSPQTVFDAGTNAPSKRTLVWGVAAIVVVGCVFSAVGFYYFQQAPTTHVIPSPSVATMVEKQPAKSLPIVIPDIRPDERVGSAVRIAAVPTEPTPDDAATFASAPEIKEPTDTQSTPQKRNEILSPSEADIDEFAQGPAVPADVSTPYRAAPEVGIRVGELQIARSSKKAAVDDVMGQAYAAYVAGDFAHSEDLYNNAIALRPRNRDALLGLAALRLRDGDVSAAHKLYRDVLKIDPANPTASAALFSIEGGAGDRVTESGLKMLLDDGVDVGYVYFSLGNLYARNARWADAQQAYFEAVRNNPSNPDYNYNLAVSLDRIGKRTTATEYYETAIDLTQTNQAGFDPATALSRVQNISGAAQR